MVNDAIENEYCNITEYGSTSENGYEEYHIDLAILNTSQQIDFHIEISTCSDFTNFDTYLNLYNNKKTQGIQSCDDYCSTPDTTDISFPCIKDGRVSHNTVWNLDLSPLIMNDTDYILEVNGYQGATGSFELIIVYHCDLDISITSLQTTTQVITTTQPTTDPTNEPTLDPTENPTQRPSVSITESYNSKCSEFSCPFIIESVSINQDTDELIFTFNGSVVDGILRRTDWDSETFQVYNFRTNNIETCKLNRYIDASSIATMSTAANWIENDKVVFTETVVFCDELSSLLVLCFLYYRREKIILTTFP